LSEEGQMIQLSDRARDQIQKLLEEQPEHGVRVFIQGFG